MGNMMKRIICLLMCLLMVAAGLPAAAEGAEAADKRVESFLAEQAAAQKDAWARAILEAGARDVHWEGNTASFFLLSFDPDLKALGAYA